MSLKLVFAAFLLNVYGSHGIQTNWNWLVEKCGNDEVYPFPSVVRCNTYIRCKDNTAIIVNCPQPGNVTEQLKYICNNATGDATCGFNGCNEATISEIVAFESPNTTLTRTPYYAYCFQGLPVKVGMCTPKEHVESVFEIEDNISTCKSLCEDGDVWYPSECTSIYYECVDSTVVSRNCPPGSFYDVALRMCSFSSSCSLTVSPSTENVVTVSSPDTSSPQTPSTITPSPQTPSTPTPSPPTPSPSVRTRRPTKPRKR